MMQLMPHIKKVVKEDVRLFFAPFQGAIDAVKREISKPQPQTKNATSVGHKSSHTR